MDIAQRRYRAALDRHRGEASEDSRRIVAEAYQRLIEIKRDAIIEAWEMQSARVCPRCGWTTRVEQWSAAVDQSDAEYFGVRRVPPDWAAHYAAHGVEQAKRYVCTDCGFAIVRLG